MKAYLLQLDGREEGPHTEEQVAQMFADGRINHHTRCNAEVWQRTSSSHSASASHTYPANCCCNRHHNHGRERPFCVGS